MIARLALVGWAAQAAALAPLAWTVATGALAPDAAWLAAAWVGVAGWGLWLAAGLGASWQLARRLGGR